MQGGVAPPKMSFYFFSDALWFTKHVINHTKHEKNYASNGLL